MALYQTRNAAARFILFMWIAFWLILVLWDFVASAALPLAPQNPKQSTFEHILAEICQRTGLESIRISKKRQ
jgi:hypothetical protein